MPQNQRDFCNNEMNCDELFRYPWGNIFSQIVYAHPYTPDTSHHIIYTDISTRFLKG